MFVRHFQRFMPQVEIRALDGGKERETDRHVVGFGLSVGFLDKRKNTD